MEMKSYPYYTIYHFIIKTIVWDLYKTMDIMLDVSMIIYYQPTTHLRTHSPTHPSNHPPTHSTTNPP